MARDAAPRLSIDDLLPDMRDVRVVDWPGTDRKVGLLLLRCAELQDAYFATRERFKRRDQAVDWAAKAQLDEEEGLQQVYRMLIDPEARRPEYRIFKSVEQARERLTPELRDHFVEEHLRLQDELVKSWLPASAGEAEE